MDKRVRFGVTEDGRRCMQCGSPLAFGAPSVGVYVDGNCLGDICLACLGQADQVKKEVGKMKREGILTTWEIQTLTRSLGESRAKEGKGFTMEELMRVLSWGENTKFNGILLRMVLEGTIRVDIRDGEIAFHAAENGDKVEEDEKTPEEITPDDEEEMPEAEKRNLLLSAYQDVLIFDEVWERFNETGRMCQRCRHLGGFDPIFPGRYTCKDESKGIIHWYEALCCDEWEPLSESEFRARLEEWKRERDKLLRRKKERKSDEQKEDEQVPFAYVPSV